MGPGIKIVKGSIEPIAVDVTDKFKNLTDLSSASPLYDIEDFFNEPVLTNQSAVADGMTAICKIDATTLAEGDYKLFLHFDATPDHPRLGPVSFAIVEEDM
jgi:hypothetical protein